MSDDSIFIGDRPFMNYVTGVVMQFTVKDSNKVIIKARGKYVGKAVDVSQLIITKFLEDVVKIDNVELGSENFKNDEGKEIRVSTIDITLVKLPSEE